MQNMDHQDIPALAVNNVVKEYAQWQRSGKLRDIVKTLLHPEKKIVRALDGVSFTVRRGEFLAYAGANGAGKSTTIKILSGILHPTSGEVLVLGESPAKDRISLMRKIGILFGQRSELWWDHPILTSFEWKRSVWGIPDDVYERNLALVRELLDLDDILHTFARELSLGQRMRADLGMLLLHDPQVLFLDEPTLGLDVLAKRQMIAFLKRLNEEKGTTIVVTSHDMDDLEQMAKRIILLSKGAMAFDGSFEELRAARSDATRVKVATTEDEGAPLPGLTLLSHRDGVSEYQMVAGQDMAGVLQTLSAIRGISDIEIRKAPIEEVIAKLYLSWK